MELTITLLACTAVLFYLTTVSGKTVAPILAKDAWKDMHLIGVGCIKDSKKGEREKVQANLDLLAGLWRNAHFVIYADAVSKEVWEKEIVALGRNQSYHFLLDEYRNENRTYKHYEEARIYRLLNGRNALLTEARQIVSQRRFKEENTLVAVIDLDNVNSQLWNVETIVHSMERINEWDVVSYNRPRYYDLWALRYPAYNVNCWGPGVKSKIVLREMFADIHKRLKHESLFKVYSAFNGFAFYKYQFMQHCHYYYTAGELDHPNMHLCIRNQGGRVRIFNESIMYAQFRGHH